jgi:lipopolysaccharide biosynthesis glycosyltransferase
MTTEPITLVCTSSDEFSQGLAVTIRSLMESHQDPRQVDLYVFDGGIRPETRRKLEASWTDFPKLKVTFIQPDPKTIAGMPEIPGIRALAYYRLFIPDVLPAHLRRALYLDVDILVTQDIAGLWDTDLEGKPLAAVQSTMVPYVSSLMGVMNFAQLGLDPRTKYLDSGVLIFDLDLWRKERLAQKVAQYILDHRKIIRLMDQEALNAVLANRWKELDPRWNVEYPTLPGPHAAIVHFILGIKPWHVGCQHPARDLFFEYFDRTGWKGWRPQEPKLAKVFGLLRGGLRATQTWLDKVESRLK